jgi:signal transduction histidine kinase
MLIVLLSVFLLMLPILYVVMGLHAKSLQAVTLKERSLGSLGEASAWVLLMQVPVAVAFQFFFDQSAEPEKCWFFTLPSALLVAENILMLWGLFFLALEYESSRWTSAVFCLLFGMLSTWFAQRYYLETRNFLQALESVFENGVQWFFYFSTCIQGFSFLLITMPMRHAIKRSRESRLKTVPQRFFWHRLFINEQGFTSFPLIAAACVLLLFSFVVTLAWLVFQHFNTDWFFAEAMAPGLFPSLPDHLNRYALILVEAFYVCRILVLLLIIFFTLDFFQRMVKHGEVQKQMSEKREQEAWQAQTAAQQRLNSALNGGEMGLVSWSARGPDAHLRIDPWAFNAADLHFELTHLNLLHPPSKKARSLRDFFGEWVLDSDFQLLKKNLDIFFQSQESVLKLNFRALLNDESTAHFSFMATLIRHPDNAAPLFLDGFIRDVTEESNVLNTLRDASEERLQTIYAISHDLGSPLGLIQMSSGFLSSLLKREGVYGSSAEKFVERINGCVKEAHSYLSNAMSMAKTEDSNFKFESIRLNLCVMLKRNIDAQSSIHSFDLDRVKLQLPQDCWLEEIQEYPLQMIFSNLISNAFKYTQQEDAEVCIRVFACPDAIDSLGNAATVIEVQDNGIGINDALKENLFKPFNRGDNVEGVKGTGLGLTVVKRAVRLLNADLRLLETQRGTCFRLTIPHALVKPVSTPVSN